MTTKWVGRFVVASGVALAAAAFSTPAAAQKIENSYICVFKANAVAKDAVPGEARRSVNAQGGQVKHVYRHAIRGFAANMNARAVENMRRANPRIAYCEQDQVMTGFPKPDKPGKPGGGDGGGGGGTSTQQTPWGITRVNGGVSGATGRAFVIDSGIDGSHPDLNVNEGLSAYFVGRNWDDQNGHGTHVAGTIAAIDNNIGVVGVAAGAEVVAVRVLDRRGSGSTSGVIAGVDYVASVGQQGDVANMSLGGGISTTLDNAVVNASGTVKFVLAAGNENQDANNSSPARANGNNIYTVSAMDSSDRIASFSNYGNPPVDFAEPGVSILSTYKGDGYATLSGTSMAAPHLAGILLLGQVRSGGQLATDKDNTKDTIGIH
ncbi:S8 family serine peptidase [Erythrobacter sp. HKB08]|uniref:S8 family serine peptidase n=1 Tax=Erythrobacter sp. HKB08 TaxID=2502843 RepID=UPI001008CF65|nr:S8 family serine peptidase [Erythrobacter sp. HKB08]